MFYSLRLCLILYKKFPVIESKVDAHGEQPSWVTQQATHNSSGG